MQKWIILGIVLAIIVGIVIIFFNTDIETEYVPEVEVSETELRKTIVTLYFENKETKELVKESRMIDSKELLLNPYEKLVNMLIEGPQNEENQRIIPEGTKIIETNLENGILTITVSKEFDNAEMKDKAIEEITKTLKELTEVNTVNVIVEGENA